MIVGIIIIGVGGSPLSIILRSFYIQRRVCRWLFREFRPPLFFVGSDNCSNVRDLF
jgi:hypothetical protein